MASKNRQTKSGYRNLPATQQPWLTKLFIDEWPSLSTDKFFTEARFVSVDEPRFSRFWNSGKLLKRRRKPEQDDRDDREDEEGQPKYFLTYASDTTYWIRTFISKHILGVAPSVVPSAAEPPLTYSDVNDFRDSSTPAEVEPIDADAGTRKFDLLITRYRLRCNYSEENGVTLTLVVDEGTLSNHRAFGFVRPWLESRKLCLEDAALYKFLKQKFRHAKISHSWEFLERSQGVPEAIDGGGSNTRTFDGPAATGLENGGGSPAPVDLQDDIERDSVVAVGTENGGGDTSHLLSALVAGSVTSSDRSTSGHGRKKRKENGIHDESPSKKQRRANGHENNKISSTISADDDDDDDDVVIIVTRSARVQTDSILSNWTPTTTLLEAASARYESPPPFIDLATPVEALDQRSADSISVDSLDEIIRNVDVGTLSAANTRTAVDGGDTNGADIEFEKDGNADAGVEPDPVAGSSSAIERHPAGNADDQNRRSTAAAEKTSKKKKGRSYSLRMEFRDFYLPEDLKQDCIEALLEK